MDAKRRCMLRAGASFAALAVLPAFASMPVLRESDADAQALEYTPNSRVPGSRCADCYFFQGRKSADLAPCTVFAGWRVNADGWCREFQPRGG